LKINVTKLSTILQFIRSKHPHLASFVDAHLVQLQLQVYLPLHTRRFPDINLPDEGSVNNFREYMACFFECLNMQLLREFSESKFVPTEKQSIYVGDLWDGRLLIYVYLYLNSSSEVIPQDKLTMPKFGSNDHPYVIQVRPLSSCLKLFDLS
jgi:hypothetical protein